MSKPLILTVDDDDAADDDHDDDNGRPVYGYGLWPDETGPDELAQWYPYFGSWAGAS